MGTAVIASSRPPFNPCKPFCYAVYKGFVFSFHSRYYPILTAKNWNVCLSKCLSKFSFMCPIVKMALYFLNSFCNLTVTALLLQTFQTGQHPDGKDWLFSLKCLYIFALLVLPQIPAIYGEYCPENRCYERLLDMRDNYPKYVLLTDDFAGGNYEGIKTMHVADFLLSDEYW